MPAGAFAHFDTESFRIVGELLGSGRDVYSHTTRHPYLPLELYIIWGARWLADC